MWHSKVLLWNAHQTKLSNIFYPLPSVMEVGAFVSFVRSRTLLLSKCLEREVLCSRADQRSPFFDGEVKENILQKLDGLLNLHQKDVQRIIWEKHKLTRDHLVTCLVPFQLGANIILSRLPKDIRNDCIKELQEEERRIAHCDSNETFNKYIQWVERDVFVSTGTQYLRRLSEKRHKRIPIWAVLGHTHHGKTSLLDALQGTGFAQMESGGTTQSIRVFTTPMCEERSTRFTFLDTPGKRIFVETRLHAHIITDYVLLLVSLTEGVQSQTHEGIKIALNIDRPVLVVLNKIDLFSDAQQAAEAVSKVLSDLHSAGLEVDLFHKEKQIEKLRASKSSSGNNDVTPTHNERAFKLLAPLRNLDSDFKGSRKKPVVDLRRRCPGVCISAKERKNLSMLWSLIELSSTILPPLCHSVSTDYKSHRCSVQAVILESSKHLFDEEGFRINNSRQTLQRRQDRANEKRQKKIETLSIRTRIHSALSAAQNKAYSANPTSSNCLVLSVIVKEGCITKGMPFIADQSRGRVDYMVDALGNTVEQANPGMYVTIIDLHSSTGCPGVGTHVLSMTSEEERNHIFEYRRILQWFIECFPDRLNLLRPRGMDVSFAHLGDYGQLCNTSTLDYQLLYGPPPSGALLPGNSGKAPSAKSIAEFMAEVNAKDDNSHEEPLLEDGMKKKPLMSENLLTTLQMTWKQLQPLTPLKSQEEYDQLCKNCIQIGILLKVDSWHSARMLHREIAKHGTRKILFQVVGIRFGELLVDDILFFGRAVKMAICYRTPMSASVDLDRYLEANDTWTLQTDDVADVVHFLKFCAVALHKEHASDDFDVIESNKKSFFMIMNAGSKTESNPSGTSKDRRRRKLLITPNFSQRN